MDPRSRLEALRQPSVMLSYSSAATLSLFSALIANFLFASGHDVQRCVEIVALGMSAIILLARAVTGQSCAVPTSALTLLLAFFAIGLVSAATALSPRHAVFEWSSILLLLAMVFAVASEVASDARRLPVLLRWVGIACGLYSLRLVAAYAAALASGYQIDVYTLPVGFSNARFLNHVQTALLPLIVLLLLQSPPSTRWRTGWFALAASWWAVIFVTEARATVLALTVACAAAFFLRRAHARRFIAMMAWTALAGAVVYALIFILLPVMCGMQPLGMPTNVVARTVANPSSDRKLLWDLAAHVIAAHPWLGVGPQHFAHEGASLYSGAHPHNWLLQIAAEWGIPAMLCLAGVVVLGARRLILTGARIAPSDLANQQMLVMLLVACTAIFVDGLFSGVIVMPQSQLAIALVLGVALAWVRMQDGAARKAASCGPVPRAATAVLVAAGLGGLIWSVAPDIVQHVRGDKLTATEQMANPRTQWPRLWEAGFF